MKILTLIRKIFINVSKGFVTLLMFGMLCAGCLTKEEQIEITVSLTKTSFDFDSGGGTGKCTVSTNTNEWKIDDEEKPQWLHISKGASIRTGEGLYTNTEVTFSADPNMEIIPKEATVYITGTGIRKQTVTAKIAGAPHNLDVSTNPLTFLASGGQTSLQITSNSTWEIDYDSIFFSMNEPPVVWIRVEPKKGSGNGAATVTAYANNTIFERKGTITINADGVEAKTIEVTQAGVTPFLTVPTTPITFPASGGQPQSFNITSNTNWEITSSAAWLSVSPQKDSGSKTVTVAAQANSGRTERNATITVAGAGVTVKIQVTQSGVAPTLTVTTPSPLKFSANEETKRLDIKSNTNWTVSSNDNWLKFSQPGGSNDGYVNVTALANTGTSRRTGRITVQGEGIASATAIDVEQEGMGIQHFLTVTPSNTQIVSFRGGSQTFAVKSDIEWNVNAGNNSSWIKFSTNRGTGDGSVDVTFLPNSSSQRNGSIIFTGNGVSNVSISIQQNYTTNPFLIVYDPELLQEVTTLLTFSGYGETKTFDMYSNTSWTVTSFPVGGWIGILPENGSGNGTLQVTTTHNSGTDRSGTLYFNRNTPLEKRIRIEQPKATP